MNLIFNSTPLIYLSKTKVLELVKGLKTENLISKKVYQEVVEAGKKKGKADALYIEKLVQDGLFKIKSPKNKEFLNRLSKIEGLHPGDVHTLALAKELNGVAVIDDEIGRNVGELFDIKHKGTIFVLFELVKLGILEKKEAKEVIDQMIKLGWFCSTDIYAKIIKSLNLLTPC